jgi:hypothetical protein
MPRLYYLENRLKKLELAVYERRAMLRLDTGAQVWLDWNQAMHGCHNLLTGVNSSEAFAIEHCTACDNEWIWKNVEMLRAVTHPIDT